MTRFTPFPPAIAETSARNASVSYAARRGKPAGDHVTVSVAAYRLADGRVRPAHDLYDPSYPEGVEPGLADMASELRYYPNGTSGYVSRCTGFTDAEELLEHAAEWGAVAVARVRSGDLSGYVMALAWIRTTVRVMDALNSDDRLGRECRHCDAILPTGYQFGMCGQCHSALYPRQHHEYDDVLTRYPDSPRIVRKPEQTT